MLEAADPGAFVAPAIAILKHAVAVGLRVPGAVSTADTANRGVLEVPFVYVPVAPLKDTVFLFVVLENALESARLEAIDSRDSQERTNHRRRISKTLFWGGVSRALRRRLHTHACVLARALLHTFRLPALRPSNPSAGAMAGSASKACTREEDRVRCAAEARRGVRAGN